MQSNSKSQSRRESLVGRASRLADRLIAPAGAPDVPSPSSVQRIVIIKPCCLGDMLMATPAIRALSQHYPDAEIAIVTDQWTQPAIETNPRISHLIINPPAGGLRGAIQLGLQMRRFSFDLGISLDRSPVTALSLWLAGIPVRAGIDSHNRGVGLTHRAEPDPDQHETNVYLAVIESLGIDRSSEAPEYYVPDDAIQRVREFVPERDTGPVVVLHAGGAVNPGVAMLEKRWPATNYGELASLLSREAGARIVLVGADSDRTAVETVRDFARVPVIDLCGQLSLAELAALCLSASLFVGNDSGVTHLASAVGTPVVAIFGPTNPNRYRPLGRRTLVCAPESSWTIPDPGDLRSSDPQSLPDIAHVPLPQVLNSCLELLGGSR